MDRPKLMLVDDIPENLDVLYQTLKDEYDLFSAGAGRSALMTVQTERPDLILLDIMMPDMDGYAVCEALKRDPDTRDIPIIFITGRTDIESETRALSAGGVDFITKPFAPEVVRARVHLHLELAQHRHQLEKLVDQRTGELATALEKAEVASQAKSMFLATMSHELRTPLTAILGLSEMIQEGIMGNLSQELLKAMKTIEQSGRHLLEIITDILDFSKIESDRMELEFSLEPVEVLCHSSLSLVKEAAQHKQLAVSFTPCQELGQLWTDQRRLKQILVNLLSNAIKFTPTGGEFGLDVVRDGMLRVIRFTVWDTGIGIAPDDLTKLFQPFIQVDSSLARRFEGTGLGLALVSRLAHLLGGDVSVTSEVGKGSRFCLSLPCQNGNPLPSRHKS